jgi:hypothetical protein
VCGERELTEPSRPGCHDTSRMGDDTLRPRVNAHLAINVHASPPFPPAAAPFARTCLRKTSLRKTSLRNNSDQYSYWPISPTISPPRQLAFTCLLYTAIPTLMGIHLFLPFLIHNLLQPSRLVPLFAHYSHLDALNYAFTSVHSLHLKILSHPNNLANSTPHLIIAFNPVYIHNMSAIYYQ